MIVRDQMVVCSQYPFDRLKQANKIKQITALMQGVITNLEDYKCDGQLKKKCGCPLTLFLFSVLFGLVDIVGNWPKQNFSLFAQYNMYA